MIKNMYDTLSEYLQNRFGGKIAKISIDGGFSCPNRENGGKGCLFCSKEGAGEFAGDLSESITGQIIAGKKIMDRKWKNKGYIAYFQNFTNTYGSIERLKYAYDEALACDGIVGLAIATRPDCLDKDILKLLNQYNEKILLWLELGFQTSNEKTADLINRGYGNNVFEDAIANLKKLSIKTVVHLIAGLPGENKDDFINSVNYLNNYEPWGIKFHSIYIQSDSMLNEYSNKTGFEPLGMYDYIDWVTDALNILNKDIIVHRVTGDPDKSKLVKPVWQKDKLRVLSEIRRIYLEKSNKAD